MRPSQSKEHIKIEFGTRKLGGGYLPIIWVNNAVACDTWSATVFSLDEARSIAMGEASAVSLRFTGDWYITIEERK